MFGQKQREKKKADGHTAIGNPVPITGIYALIHSVWNTPSLSTR
jgi:hypothetical protein